MPFLSLLSTPFQSGFRSHHSTQSVLSRSPVPSSLLNPMVPFSPHLTCPICSMWHDGSLRPSLKLFFHSAPMITWSCDFLATSTGHSLSVCFVGSFSSLQSLNIGSPGAQSLDFSNHIHSLGDLSLMLPILSVCWWPQISIAAQACLLNFWYLSNWLLDYST